MQKILLIGPIQQLQENIGELLSLNHYEVVPAANGKTGITMAKERHPEKPVHFRIPVCRHTCVNPVAFLLHLQVVSFIYEQAGSPLVSHLVCSNSRRRRRFIPYRMLVKP